MNRDEREAQHENSLAGVSEFARDVAGFSPFLATLAVDQIIKPTISDIFGPIRRKAVRGAASNVSTAARKVVSKHPAEQKTSTDRREESDEDSNDES